MTKVYVLFQGRYDPEPVAIFSRKEDAQAIIDDAEKSAWKGSGAATLDVEEFDLDGHTGARLMNPWEVKIDKKSGVISSDSGQLNLYHPTKPKISEYHDCFRIESPISHEHAVKVAIEKREEWLRSQNPPNNQESES